MDVISYTVQNNINNSTATLLNREISPYEQELFRNNLTIAITSVFCQSYSYARSIFCSPVPVQCSVSLRSGMLLGNEILPLG